MSCLFIHLSPIVVGNSIYSLITIIQYCGFIIRTHNVLSWFQECIGNVFWIWPPSLIIGASPNLNSNPVEQPKYYTRNKHQSHCHWRPYPPTVPAFIVLILILILFINIPVVPRMLLWVASGSLMSPMLSSSLSLGKSLSISPYACLSNSKASCPTPIAA